jgi:long-chain acyl-CoA synthetase
MSETRDTSLGAMFFDRAKKLGAVTAFKVKRNGNHYSEVSFAESARRTEAIAAGILSIEGGIARRASIGLVASTSMEWVLVDMAVMSLDVLMVPIYPTLLAAEIGYILIDSGCEIVFVEDKEQLEKCRSILNGFTFFDKQYAKSALKVRRFVVIDPKGVEPASDWESLDALEARGRQKLDDTKQEREERLRGAKREDIATYGYTSGTTGPPKGVIQTHDNWLSLLEVSADMGLFTEAVRKTGAFLFLPLAHSFGRLIEFAAFFHGGPVIISAIPTLAEDLAKSRPGLVPAAPRVFEKIYARITAAVATANPRRQKLFQWAIETGKATIPYRQKNRPLPLALRVKHKLADRLVLSKIRERLGLDRCETMLSGSAPLAPVVQDFFWAIGVNLFEGYGLTETCPALTANRPSKWKLQTVGTPLRNVEIKIAPDGEILARGPNVTRGYLNRDDANAESFVDGWFHTGDIGEFDSDGFLRITDRKKDLLKTSGGKYVAPQKIEGLLKSKPMIAEAVVIGDNLKFCTALLLLDDDGLKSWADRTGNPPDRKHPALIAALQKSIDEVNRDLASFESIKYFRVVDEPFTVENGLLTGSFKVKRKEVNKRFKALIDDMYSSGAKEKEAA